MARSTYYERLKSLEKPDKYHDVKEVIKKIFKDSKETYGYRRIHCILTKLGFTYCLETVRHLMTQLGLKVTIYSNKNKSTYRSYRGKVGQIAPNILKQNFNESIPYKVLHTDISQKKLSNSIRGYISPVIDEASGQVVACAISSHPDQALINETLSQLFHQLPHGSQSILHSEQGWHYQLPFYRQQLRDHQIIQSMSRKGNCLDNSPVESFFNLLKRECLNRIEITTLTQLKLIVKRYIKWYNNNRISLNKNGMTPNEYIQCHSNI